MSDEAASLLIYTPPEPNQEVFEPLNETDIASDELSAIKDPRESSVFSAPEPRPRKDVPAQTEQPKSVASRSRKDAFLRSLVHIPAITMTIGTLSLSFRGVFWQAPTTYTNTVLDMLQFVAKVHEGLIQFSLTTIVFHRIRYEIISRHGIPFGLLSSGLQYSSLMILTRTDFRQVLGNSRQLRRYLGLVFIVVLAFLLATTSGPSAAIAVLPRLEWWPIRSSQIFGDNAPPAIYLNTSTGVTFPAVVTAAESPCVDDPRCTYINVCSSLNATGKFWCPSGGLDTILTSGLVQSLMSGDLILSPAQILTSSYDLASTEDYDPSQSSISTFSRSLNGNILRDGSGNATGDVFVASVVPDTIAIALGTFWENQEQTISITRPMAKTSSAQNELNGLQKPLVQVQCTGSFHILTNSTPDVVSFPSTYHSPATTSDQPWTVPLAGILTNSTFDDSSQDVTFEWVDLGMPEEIRPSASAIFLVSEGVYNMTGANLPSYNNVFTCTVDAMWIPSEAWIDPTIDDVVHETISNPLEERYHFEESRGKVKLAQDWLDVLNVYTEDGETTFQIIGDNCVYYNRPNVDYSLVEVCLEASVALFVTDGLARMQITTNQLWLWQGNTTLYDWDGMTDYYDTPARVLQSWFNSTSYELVQFTIDIYQYGYGYGFQGSTGIYIATVILLIYVLVALIHMAIIIIGGWSSDT